MVDDRYGRTIPRGSGVPDFSPLYYGFKLPYCTWCSEELIFLDDVGLCMTCDRTVRP
jgi:hypothetical protein